MLTLNLLGTPEIRLNGETLSLGTAKARALLIYLAVGGNSHSRDTILDLLWSEMPSKKARRNLTATLSTIRKAIGAYLVVDGNTLAFNQALPYRVDTLALSHALTTGDSASLEEAVALYRGEFLAGFAVKNAFVFEEWVLAEAERVREQMVQALLALVETAIANRETLSGIEFAGRLLEIEPWLEEAYRQMMVLYAQSGRIEAALTQFETCRRVLADELGVEPAPETVALYQRLQSGTVQPPHNLPPPINAFVGRKTELQLALDRLQDANCRLLSVVGPGGVGKSRFSAEIARRTIEPDYALAKGSFADGVFLVTLADIEPQEATATALLNAIAEAVDLDLHGSATPRHQLFAFVRDKSLLLLLDNLEHFLAHRDVTRTLNVLTSLLHKAAGLKLLITSREILNLPAEWVVQLRGLHYPTISTASDLAEYDALALFVRRAQQARAGYQLAADDAPAVVELCQLLDGLPLGIELAASWIRYLSCAEIVSEIRSGLARLESTTRHVAQRHRTLHAVVAYSWHLLSPQEQMVLQQLTVFRGGFGRKAAAEICGATMPLLIRLADKSLITRSATGRYDLHALVHHYTKEQLSSALALTLGQKHSEFYTTLAERCYADYQRGVNSADLLRTEWSNVRGAWRWSSEHDCRDQLHRLLQPVTWYLTRRALFDEQTRLLTDLLAVIADKQLQARIKLRLTEVYYYRGDYEAVEQLVEAGLQHTNSAEDRAIGLNALANVARRRGDYTTTKRLGREAEQLFRTAGNEVRATLALSHIALVAADEGDYALAEKIGKQVIAFFQRVNDVATATRWQSNLANTYIRQAKFKTAKPLLEEAFTVARRHNYRFTCVIAGVNLGMVLTHLGAFAEAKTHLRDSITLAQEIGTQRWVATALDGLSNNSVAQQCWQEAAEFAQEALAISVALDNSADILSHLLRLAQAQAGLGNTIEALRLAHFVWQHPSTLQQDRVDSGNLVEKVGVVSAEISASAQAWAQQHTLAEVTTHVY